MTSNPANGEVAKKNLSFMLRAPSGAEEDGRLVSVYSILHTFPSCGGGDDVTIHQGQNSVGWRS